MIPAVQREMDMLNEIQLGNLGDLRSDEVFMEKYFKYYDFWKRTGNSVGGIPSATLFQLAYDYETQREAEAAKPMVRKAKVRRKKAS